MVRARKVIGHRLDATRAWVVTAVSRMLSETDETRVSGDQSVKRTVVASSAG
jgi:hypothetical protein